MNRTNMNIVVQGSSKSWSGSTDSSMNLVDGFPVIYWTLKKLVENFPNSKIVIAAPLFDKDGDFLEIANRFNGRVQTFFDNDASPLLRMIGVHDKFFKDEEFFLRIDALNMFFKQEDLTRMYSIAVDNAFDCVKFPDDYPSQFTADVYRYKALIKMKNMIPVDSPFVIHPKYFLTSEPNFSSYFYDKGELTNEDLSTARASAKNIYLERDEVNTNAIEVGDQLYFHYTLALPYIKQSDKILDAACGNGFGLVRLAAQAGEVYGVDFSEEAIATTKRRVGGIQNIKLFAADVTKLPFADATFDVITSFETVEHVDATSYVSEICRVLKSDGLLIVSTPQNSRGECPVNPHHLHEYSLNEFKQIFAGFFQVEKIIGIKQGTVVIKDDPYGTNMFAIFRKK